MKFPLESTKKIIEASGKKFDELVSLFGEEKSNQVISLVKERLNLIVDLQKEVGFFLNSPSSYDPKVLNKRQMESLAAAGAFDSINSNRNEVMSSIETLLRYASMLSAEKESGQHSLFGGSGEAELPKPPLPTLPPFEPLERMLC